MKGVFKKCIALLLCMVTVLSCLVFSGLTIKSQAYSTWNINGKSFTYLSFTSATEQSCWGYAQQAYQFIWGTSFDNTRSESSNYLKNLPIESLKLTAANAKAYISNAALGSVIRVCNAGFLGDNDGWGHSCIIVAKDSNGFTAITGGYGSSPTYSKELYYTWDSFVQQMGYEYIKYIKWPGGASNSPSVSYPTSSNAAVVQNVTTYVSNAKVTVSWSAASNATSYCDNNYKIERNNFDSILLTFIVRGSFSFVENGTERTAHSGEIALIDCFKPHSYYTNDSFEAYWLHISGANTYELFKEITARHSTVVTADEKIEKIIKNIYDIIKNSRQISESEMSLLIYELFMSLFAVKNPMDEGAINRAMDFISEHYGEVLTVENVA